MAESKSLIYGTLFPDLQSPPTQSLLGLLSSGEERCLYFSSSARTGQEQRAQFTRNSVPLRKEHLVFPSLVSLAIFHFGGYVPLPAVHLPVRLLRIVPLLPRLSKGEVQLLIFCFTWKSWQIFRGVIKGSGSRRKTGTFEKHC